MQISFERNGKQAFLPFLAILLILLSCCTVLLSLQIINTAYVRVLVISFLTPYFFIISNMMTELYGQGTYRYLYITASICQICFALLAYGILDSHSVAVYRFSSITLVKFSIFNTIGLYLSPYISTYLTLKLKFFTLNRILWSKWMLNILTSIIYTLISVGVTFYADIPFASLLSCILWAILLHLFSILAMAYPTSLFIALLYIIGEASLE